MQQPEKMLEQPFFQYLNIQYSLIIYIGYLKKKGLEYQTLKIIVLKTVTLALLQIISIQFLSNMEK